MASNARRNTYNVPAQDPERVHGNYINGTTEEILARQCITELCKGWPVYRDFSEWHNFRSLFTRGAAYVWTAWSGPLPIDEFISASIQGRAHGDFIAHRETGTLANVNLSKGRGIGKMKATVTQRFTIQDIPVDIDCDCRFIFFCRLEDGGWKVQYVRVFYEKDKVVPVDGKAVPEFPKDVLAKYTPGYQYLAAAQHALGHEVLENLPDACNEGFFKMYDAMADWLEGRDVDLFWDKK